MRKDKRPADPFGHGNSREIRGLWGRPGCGELCSLVSGAAAPGCTPVCPSQCCKAGDLTAALELGPLKPYPGSGSLPAVDGGLLQVPPARCSPCFVSSPGECVPCLHLMCIYSQGPRAAAGREFKQVNGTEVLGKIHYASISRLFDVGDFKQLCGEEMAK